MVGPHAPKAMRGCPLVLLRRVPCSAGNPQARAAAFWLFRESRRARGRVGFVRPLDRACRHFRSRRANSRLAVGAAPRRAGTGAGAASFLERDGPDRPAVRAGMHGLRSGLANSHAGVESARPPERVGTTFRERESWNPPALRHGANSGAHGVTATVADFHARSGSMPCGIRHGLRSSTRANRRRPAIRTGA